MEFVKYQGTGNDFILVDGRKGAFKRLEHLVPQLCDRKFGIGSDGLISIEEDLESAFYMNFFNPDGSKSFCGNGSRCAMQFARELGIIDAVAQFRAIDGIHEGRISDGIVSILMQKVKGVTQLRHDFVINTGSPHYIIFTGNVDTIDLLSEARHIRYGDTYATEGINVNFVEELAQPCHIRMRTYERGVEDETLSCGTGVTAAAISYAHTHPGTSLVHVTTRGGKLQVRLNSERDGSYTDIWLEGPAKKVFSGNIEL
ncbi:MAG: diaminopimelate epimerase [Flavobacteriales bacterium]|nr:diaminopimelate epimerase [Flavobacteriales bacterium]